MVRPTHQEIRTIAQKVRLPLPDGKEVWAVPIAFEPEREPWSHYDLADGGRVRMRMTITKMFQVVDDDDRPARNATGERLIVVQSTNQIVVDE